MLKTTVRWKLWRKSLNLDNGSCVNFKFSAVMILPHIYFFYRGTHKGGNIKDDCTELFFFISYIFLTLNVSLSLQYHYVNQLKTIFMADHPKLYLFIKELQVVIKVSSFVGNPVHKFQKCNIKKVGSNHRRYVSRMFYTYV